MLHKITVRLECDNDTENPFDWDTAWRMVKFNGRQYRDAESPDNEEFHTIGFKRKLETGTAFVLDCYDHSSVHWSIAGTGMQCSWDTSNSAGLLICDDPSAIGRPKHTKDVTSKATSKTTLYNHRLESAKLMLDVYNAWANGSCLYFSVDVTEVDGEEVDIALDSCGGFIMCNDNDDAYVMNDYIVPAIVSYLEKAGNSGAGETEFEIEVEGPMDHLFDADDITQAVNAKLAEKAATASQTAIAA